MILTFDNGEAAIVVEVGSKIDSRPLVNIAGWHRETLRPQSMLETC